MPSSIRIDCTTTFTAVGYNDNGSSRGLPIKITLASGNLDIRFRLADNTIHINSVDNADGSYDYTPQTVVGQPKEQFRTLPLADRPAVAGTSQSRRGGIPGNADGSYDYTIIPLGAEVSQSNRVGHTVDNVDISTLPEGLYILAVYTFQIGKIDAYLVIVCRSCFSRLPNGLCHIRADKCIAQFYFLWEIIYYGEC